MANDIGLFEIGKLRSIWFDINGLMTAWRPAAKARKPRRKRGQAFKAMMTAAAFAFGASTAATTQAMQTQEPMQLSLTWPVDPTPALTKYHLHQSLKGLRRLKANWDGRGAAAPIERSISVAEYILPQLPNIIADAQAGLNGDGHVFLRIARNNRVAYITVEPRTMHLFYVEPGSPNVYIDDEQFNGKIVPAAIKKTLERLTS